MNQCPQCGQAGDGKFCPECGVEMMTACWNCGQARAVRSKFCSHCNAPSEPPAAAGSGVTGGNVKIGDIGVLRGTIDASTHVSTSIGSQTNISGPVHINMSASSTEPSADVIIEKVRTALAARDYQLASHLASQAVRLYPDTAEGRYFQALAALRNRRPKLMALDETRAIESLIVSAIALDPQCHYLYFLALVRDDFYSTTGMRMPSPYPTDLVRQADAARCSSSELAFMLAHVPIPQSRLRAHIERRCQ